MNASERIPVLGAITIWILGLKVLPLNYLGFYSLCSLVASFIYASRNFAIRTPIEVGPINEYIRMANAECFGIVLIDARGYADIMFILTQYSL